MPNKRGREREEGLTKMAVVNWVREQKGRVIYITNNKHGEYEMK